VVSQASFERYSLNVVDKASQRLLVTWPISGQVAAQLSGPSEGIALKNGFAYFITVREHADEKPLAAKGAQFLIDEVSLATGEIKKIALPKKCTNPRMGSFKGNPVVFSSTGNSVWQVNVEKKSVEDILLNADISAILASEDSADRAGKLPPGAFAAFVSIPDSGIFRLSKSGDVHQVADAKLTPKVSPQSAAHLSSLGNVERVFASSLSGKPMIGVVRKREGQWTYSSVDPKSMKSVAEVNLPSNAVPESIAPASDAILFVDRKAGSINKASSKGTTTVWKLDEFPKNLYNSRIISVSNS
jgi:hypothetical protein